tara:strand:- start:3303 stop:4334 length:1032 start_codon:yes stop_codon:yes gene_type:complete
MLRCLELAKNGLGSTYPNPMVGSVIVYNNEIIGEGWHRKAGLPHAEVNAVKSVKNEAFLPDSTIYVSLEPCSHYGKTPPCSDLIITKKIKKVVIGTVDPFAAVAGRGIKKLLDAGCEVMVGVLEKECQDLNSRFFTFHQKKRPYIILKWAQTADGFIAPKQRDEAKPVWITNNFSRQLTHKWRTEEQAILIGTATAIADNPSLTARDWQGFSPTRIVIDRTLRIPPSSAVFNDKAKTIVFSEKRPDSEYKNEVITLDFSKNLPRQICDQLYKQELQSLIIEGGTKTLQSFIDASLWDEARVFTGNNYFNDGVKAPVLSGSFPKEQEIATDKLKIYTNHKTDEK